MPKGSFKIVCHSLDTVLLIKNMSNNDISFHYEILKQKLEKANVSILNAQYMTMLAKIFLEDTSLIGVLIKDAEDNDDAEELNSALSDIYYGITKLYPMFSLEYICEDINQTLYLSSLDPEERSFIEDTAKDALEELFSPEKQSMKKAGGKGKIKLVTLSDIQRLERFLKSKVIGQDEAIAALIDSVKVIVSQLYKKGSFFFIGPTGVGKTLLGKLFGKKFSGNFKKVNCAEYAGAHEYAKLIGSPPGYVGYNEGSLLKKMAEKSNKWVFIFDEIEKADDKLHEILLSLMDDGTCTDNGGNVLDFTESVFILTSNQGVRDIKWKKVGFDKVETTYEEAREEIIESVKKKFSPEFINRIDSFIIFNSLTKEDALKIASLELKAVPIKKSKDLLSYIVENGYSLEYGARNIARFIKKKIATKVADCILKLEVPKEGTLYTPSLDRKKNLKIIETISYNTGDNDGLEPSTKRTNTKVKRKASRVVKRRA
jgi:ATP-dependent protease Clp ATPase subunit